MFLTTRVFMLPCTSHCAFVMMNYTATYVLTKLPGGETSINRRKYIAWASKYHAERSLRTWNIELTMT